MHSLPPTSTYSTAPTMVADINQVNQAENQVNQAENQAENGQEGTRVENDMPNDMSSLFTLSPPLTPAIMSPPPPIISTTTTTTNNNNNMAMQEHSSSQIPVVTLPADIPKYELKEDVDEDGCYYKNVWTERLQGKDVLKEGTSEVVCS